MCHDVTPQQDDRGVWYVPMDVQDRIWAISEWVEYPDGVAWVRADRVQAPACPSPMPSGGHGIEGCQ